MSTEWRVLVGGQSGTQDLHGRFWRRGDDEGWEDEVKGKAITNTDELAHLYRSLDGAPLMVLL